MKTLYLVKYVTYALYIDHVDVLSCGDFGGGPHGIQPIRGDLADRRRTALSLFCLAALPSVIAISLGRKDSVVPHALFALAVMSAGAAIFFLLRFLRTNDEREQQTNYRALTFAYTGTLICSAAIGFMQSFGLDSAP